MTEFKTRVDPRLPPLFLYPKTRPGLRECEEIGAEGADDLGRGQRQQREEEDGRQDGERPRLRVRRSGRQRRVAVHAQWSTTLEESDPKIDTYYNGDIVATIRRPGS